MPIFYLFGSNLSILRYRWRIRHWPLGGTSPKSLKEPRSKLSVVVSRRKLGWLDGVLNEMIGSVITSLIFYFSLDMTLWHFTQYSCWSEPSVGSPFWDLDRITPEWEGFRVCVGVRLYGWRWFKWIIWYYIYQRDASIFH